MVVDVPPSQSIADHSGVSVGELEQEIQNVRQEIQKLTQRRQILGATLQNATKIQSVLRTRAERALPADISPLLQTFEEHTECNSHRLAFGVTAFPFIDPSPETINTPGRSLLGIRIDTCGHNGKYRDPHYIFCQRTGANDNEMRIHKHTIPAFVPLKMYEEQYLPTLDEGYRSGESVDGDAAPKQDLHGLVERVRKDLVSWVYRQDAVQFLKEGLELVPPGRDDDSFQNNTIGKFGVESISAVDTEARYIRIEWQEGRQALMGRVKISDEGMIERAVIYGDNGARFSSAEKILSGGGNSVPITELVSRLERIDQNQTGVA